MVVDGVMSTSGSVGRGGGIFSSEVPPLHQCLSLEHISFAPLKYTRSGELRRALGSLGSATEDLPFKASNFRPPPVAIEELKQIRDSVLSASIKARERSKMFRDSINKLEKYREATGSKKRQRTELLSNEKTGGSSLLKMVGQPPRNLFDQSALRVEDKAKCSGMNKRFRTSAGEIRVDSKSGSLSKDPLSNEKDQNICKTASGVSVPEEKMLRLSSVGEGWDKNMMKRKRSVGTLANRSVDVDIKRSMHSELNSDSKSSTFDTTSIRLSGRSIAKQASTTSIPGTVIKGKMSRAPRTGSVIVVNSSEVQSSSEACDGWELPSSTNKVISLDSMPNHHRTANSSYMIGQWGGQRQQKSSRSRRTNVVSPVTNNDEVPSAKVSPPIIGGKKSLDGNIGFLESVDVSSNASKSKIKVESMPSPCLLSEGEETRGSELRLEEKVSDCNDVLVTGKTKMRAFMYPTKRNKNVLNENVGDGVRRQGRTVRGLSLSKPVPSQSEVKLENVSTPKRIQSPRPGSEKIRSRTGRPPSRNRSDGRPFTRNSDSEDDHEELLAAAAAARKASYNSCTGRFWKKMEPIFSSVSAVDVNYMKQQLSLAEELGDSLSTIRGAHYNVLGVVMHKEKADVSSGKSGCDSNQVVDKDEALSVGIIGGKFSSLYQRVLSAVIEEDEIEGIYNGFEGVNMSFQCASDDSHCGSCNYVEVDNRDRDILDSEAESMVDFQIQKRSGDRFSCNRSVTSNTTRNTSMSDSLYSSGRWLGDDGISFSDAEYVGGSWQNDVGGPASADLTTFGTLVDSEYELMCVDDRLVLELQSIGLHLDGLPDLADGEEIIERDMMELKEGLFERIGKKKDNLVKIDKAMQDDGDREKRFIEQVAMEQLIQMAYKRRMACRRNNAKTVMRKVSKQVAVGFIERTLTRCKTFELTGQSCFSEPALQNVLFAAPQANDSSTITATDNQSSHVAPKSRNETAKSEFTSFSVLDSCVDDLGRGYIGSPPAANRSCENGFSDLESLSNKGKKREILLDDVGGLSSRGPPAYGSSVVEVAKGKRSDRDSDQGRGALMVTAKCETHSDEQKLKLKLKDSTSTVHPSSSLVQWENIENHKTDRELGSNAQEVCKEVEERLDFDAIDPLDISNDLNAPEDINSWFMGLQDYDSAGLEIPMDDLNMVLM